MIIKKFLPFIFFIGLIGCQSSTGLNDYYGQSYPDSLPVIFAPDIISIKGRLEHGISFSPDTRELAFGILRSLKCSIKQSKVSAVRVSPPKADRSDLEFI